MSKVNTTINGENLDTLPQEPKQGKQQCYHCYFSIYYQRSHQQNKTKNRCKNYKRDQNGLKSNNYMLPRKDNFKYKYTDQMKVSR